MIDLSNGVDETDVRDIYDTSASGAAVSAAIEAAKQVARQNLDTTNYNSSENEYERVILYLSVHYLAIDPQLTAYNVGDANHPFERSTGDGIRETFFGRLANQMTDGKLAQVGTTKIDFDVIDV